MSLINGCAHSLVKNNIDYCTKYNKLNMNWSDWNAIKKRSTKDAIVTNEETYYTYCLNTNKKGK